MHTYIYMYMCGLSSLLYTPCYIHYICVCVCVGVSISHLWINVCHDRGMCVHGDICTLHQELMIRYFSKKISTKFINLREQFMKVHELFANCL